jgi:pyruvate,water dikinase
VSGQVTPESYQVWLQDPDLAQDTDLAQTEPTWQLPDAVRLAVEGTGSLPSRLVQQVAFLARRLEAHYHGIPQDIEWSFDGDRLWLLQARSITTLLPIWTRKIAAEVIPGAIHPLTWSINRPLTCGVWGKIFTIVLGDRVQDLDFSATATLHYAHAYFNASLLGEIFRRMGLPAESLEFLTRGAKFSKPPLRSTLRNLPGLLRLAQHEWQLERDFQRDDRLLFTPALKEFAHQPATELTAVALLQRIDRILALLQSATYYSILAPLSAALRQAIFKTPDEQLDNSATPEVAALRSLQELAQSARRLLEQQGEFAALRGDQATLFSTLAQTATGQALLTRLDQVTHYYGYLSEVGTDIAVPTWREDPQPVQTLFAQFCLHPPTAIAPPKSPSGKAKRVQRRLTLKGKVTSVYSQLLAELRWSFVALEKLGCMAGWLAQSGDIFFLEFAEVRQVIEASAPKDLPDRIASRRAQLARDRALSPIPFLVYGNEPPAPSLSPRSGQAFQQLRGIGASAGLAEGRVKVVRSLAAAAEIDRNTILVVPYTDSGWAPLLARAGGLIAEVGGRLSHGAIVAREYGIPAVMDLTNATQLLQDGQLVRIDGQQGTVEVLSA